MKKGTLRNYLLSIVILFLCMNKAMAHPEQIGTCFIPKDPGKPQNGGKNVNFFVYKDHAFSSLGAANQVPLIIDGKIESLQGDDWEIGLNEKKLWNIFSNSQNINVENATCKIKFIKPTDTKSLALAQENYMKFVANNPSAKKGFIQTFKCDDNTPEEDDEDDSKTPPNDKTRLLEKKQSCCSKTLKTCVIL